MTDTYELPELPEPDGSASVVVGKVPVGPMMGDVTEEIPAWSRKLVEDFARLAVKADRERATRALDLSDDQIDMILDAAKVPEPPSGWREDYDVQVVRAIIAHLRAELYCG